MLIIDRFSILILKIIGYELVIVVTFDRSGRRMAWQSDRERHRTGLVVEPDHRFDRHSSFAGAL